MTKTEKYQLPQWELSDRILMEDFNEAMSNIEKGMDGIRTEAATNLAAQAADTAAKIGSGGKTCRIATGTYVGNGGRSARFPAALKSSPTTVSPSPGGETGELVHYLQLCLAYSSDRRGGRHPA